MPTRACAPPGLWPAPRQPGRRPPAAAPRAPRCGCVCAPFLPFSPSVWPPALARCGHGTKILLADGNYPHLTGVPAGTTRIALNVTPGLLTVDQILTPLAETVPIESFEFMLTAEAGTASAVTGYA